MNINNEDGDMYMPSPDIPAGEEVDDVVDERPWRALGSGIELGEENASDCIHWMSRKVMEHVGFQGLRILTYTPDFLYLNLLFVYYRNVQGGTRRPSRGHIRISVERGANDPIPLRQVCE